MTAAFCAAPARPLAERLLVPILGGIKRGFWWSLEFELLVMHAALRLGPQEAYTVSIAEHIRSRTG